MVLLYLFDAFSMPFLLMPCSWYYVAGYIIINSMHTTCTDEGICEPAIDE